MIVKPGLLEQSSRKSKTRTTGILHLINGEHFSGAERVQDLLAMALPECGYDIGFVCLKPDKFPRVRQSDCKLFEAGMLAAASQLMTEEVLQPPYYGNFPLGAHWALPADPRSILFMTALLPKGMRWSVVHDGMQDLSLLATAVGMGASVVRVGFEDSVWYAPGKAARTNSELVTRCVDLIEAMGGAVATPKEARQLLGVAALRPETSS